MSYGLCQTEMCAAGYISCLNLAFDTYYGINIALDLIILYYIREARLNLDARQLATGQLAALTTHQLVLQ